MSESPAANWYPDPRQRHEYRYWDGHAWTDHVSSRGIASTDALYGSNQVGSVEAAPKKSVVRQVRKAGVEDFTGVGTGSILTEPVLVINQKAKIFEVKAEYSIFDRAGRQIGVARQVGENFLAKSMSMRADADRKRRVQILDMQGNVLLTLKRPAKYVKSTVIVTAGDRSEIGRIRQKNLGIFAGFRFVIETGSAVVGTIVAEDWNAWEFRIDDAAGREIGRVSKTWAGVMKERFTKGDHYVVGVDQAIQGPLRWLVIATAIAIDIALKQDGTWANKRSR